MQLIAFMLLRVVKCDQPSALEGDESRPSFFANVFLVATYTLGKIQDKVGGQLATFVFAG